MNRKTQFDATPMSRDLDIPNGNRLRRNRRKKKKLPGKQEKIVQSAVTRAIASVEKKRRLMYIDTATGISSSVTIGQNTASTFAVVLGMTTGITEGAGQTNRTSDQIWLQSLHLNFTVTYNFTSSVFAQDYVDLIRMTVFLWHPNSSVDPVTPAEIFQNVSSSSVFANFDFEYSRQYRILRDQYFAVSGFADSTTAFALPNTQSQRHVVETVSLGNALVQYSPSATTAANHLYVAFTSNSATNNPVLAGVFRTYYYNDNA